MDHLLSVVNHLSGEPEPQDLKYAVLHLQAAAEVLLKVRLIEEHWSLVFKNPGSARRDKFEASDFDSCGPNDAITRLREIVGKEVGEKFERNINKAFFQKFLVDGSKIVGGELKEPFDALTGAMEREAVKVYLREVGLVPDGTRPKKGARGQRTRSQIAGSPVLVTENRANAEDVSLTDLLELTWPSRASVSNKSAMVELRGFEPLTFSLRTRRATNCAKAPSAHYSSTGSDRCRGGAVWPGSRRQIHESSHMRARQSE